MSGEGVGGSTALVPSTRLNGFGAIELAETLVGVGTTIGVLAVGGSDAMLLGAIVANFVVSSVINITRITRELRRFDRENTTITQHLATGQLAEARAFYWKWSVDAAFGPVAVVARYNLAWTMVRQGELEGAVAVHLAMNGNRRFLKPLTLQKLAPTSVVQLALAYGLLGELEAAEQWMLAERARQADPRIASHAAMIAFARAVIELRGGRADAAVKVLDDAWRDAEANLTGSILRPLRVLRAFAIASTGPRQAGMAEQMIEGIKPQFPEEFAFLATRWPELGVFLDAHGLR